MGEALTAETGVEEVGTTRTVSAHSRFPFGSLTKLFTATVIMQLSADGDIDLDAPLAGYLPELGTVAWRSATARQLLSHSAGLVADHEVASRSVSPRRYVLSCIREPPLTTPGTAFSYSNAGYVVLGHLIESVTGYCWREAVESFLAGPLGLRLSYADDLVGWTSVRAHAVEGDDAVPLEAELPAGWLPAGGIAGSALDLAALARLLMDDGAPTGVLDTRVATEMRQGVPGLEPFGLAEGWGAGLALYGDGWVGHDGNLDGVSANLRFHPETGAIVALTTNASSGTALWEDLWARLRPAAVTEPAPIRRRVVPDLSAYLANDYRNGGTRFEVHRGGFGELRLRDDSGFTARLLPSHKDVFTVHCSSAEMPTQLCRFLRDEWGGVTALQFSGRLAVRPKIRQLAG
ncbi:CubicO group peptidase, beta-lactamase class C family [Amycolatopsis marina]|uniref:CubicO group peptidase, beta-lactamase class C family n=2 Tax=Amycolatopsis marina TaxID=490629 RepID=A0A1I0XV03_9PSEU|nr:CubicO group peptidase, beta-lactamase class C family [Amycolatopsis marina]